MSDSFPLFPSASSSSPSDSFSSPALVESFHPRQLPRATRALSPPPNFPLRMPSTACLPDFSSSRPPLEFSVPSNFPAAQQPETTRKEENPISRSRSFSAPSSPRSDAPASLGNSKVFAAISSGGSEFLRKFQQEKLEEFQRGQRIEENFTAKCPGQENNVGEKTYETFQPVVFEEPREASSVLKNRRSSFGGFLSKLFNKRLLKRSATPQRSTGRENRKSPGPTNSARIDGRKGELTKELPGSATVPMRTRTLGKAETPAAAAALLFAENFSVFGESEEFPDENAAIQQTQQAPVSAKALRVLGFQREEFNKQFPTNSVKAARLLGLGISTNTPSRASFSLIRESENSERPRNFSVSANNSPAPGERANSLAPRRSVFGLLNGLRKVSLFGRSPQPDVRSIKQTNDEGAEGFSLNFPSSDDFPVPHISSMTLSEIVAPRFTAAYIEFLALLQREFAGENLIFLKSLELFKRSPGIEGFIELFDRFLAPGSATAMEINISSKARMKIQQVREKLRDFLERAEENKQTTKLPTSPKSSIPPPPFNSPSHMRIRTNSSSSGILCFDGFEGPPSPRSAAPSSPENRRFSSSHRSFSLSSIPPPPPQTPRTPKSSKILEVPQDLRSPRAPLSPLSLNSSFSPNSTNNRRLMFRLHLQKPSMSAEPENGFPSAASEFSAPLTAVDLLSSVDLSCFSPSTRQARRSAARSLCGELVSALAEAEQEIRVLLAPLFRRFKQECQENMENMGNIQAPKLKMPPRPQKGSSAPMSGH